jgi:type IV secretory pathway VirB10-like protein
MKECPECGEVFDDQKAFCDIDGSALVDQTDVLREALTQANAARKSSAWVTGAIGGLIGVILCVLLYIAFLAPSREDLQEQARQSQPKETTPVKPAQAAPLTMQSQPVEAPSPSETASPEAEPSPTQAPAAPTPPPAALNNGPIATGNRIINNGERAIIKMKDGTSVEADAAWEDAQGVWFRRSGLVSFVERSRVEAITEPPRRPAPAETKTP